MEETLIYLYVPSYILSYLIIKYVCLKLDKAEWTIGIRTVSLFISLFSYLVIIIGGIVIIVDAFSNRINWNKIAKW